MLSVRLYHKFKGITANTSTGVFVLNIPNTGYLFRTQSFFYWFFNPILVQYSVELSGRFISPFFLFAPPFLVGIFITPKEAHEKIKYNYFRHNMYERKILYCWIWYYCRIGLARKFLMQENHCYLMLNGLFLYWYAKDFYNWFQW